MEEIKNKVAESGLVNFDLSDLIPKGKRAGIDLKDFLYEGFVLREKEFRNHIASLDETLYLDTYVYLYCSTEAIIPLWAYFLLTSKLSGSAKKIVHGSPKDLEEQILLDAISATDFVEFSGKRVLVKGCSDVQISENCYIQLVEKLKPLVKSLMFGEACSNVPIFKN